MQIGVGDPQTLLSQFMENLTQILEMKNAFGTKTFDRQKKISSTLIRGTMRACKKRGKRGGGTEVSRKAKRRRVRKGRGNNSDTSESEDGSDSGSNSDSSNDEEQEEICNEKDPNDADGLNSGKSTRLVPTSASSSSSRTRNNVDGGEAGSVDGGKVGIDEDNINPQTSRRIGPDIPLTLRIDPRVGFVKGGRVRRRKGRDVLERALVLGKNCTVHKWRISILSTIIALRPPGLFVTAMQLHFEICRHFFEGNPLTAQTPKLGGVGPNKKELRVFRPCDLLSNLSVLYALQNFFCPPALLHRFSEEYSHLIMGNIIHTDLLNFIAVLEEKVIMSKYSSEGVRTSLHSFNFIIF